MQPLALLDLTYGWEHNDIHTHTRIYISLSRSKNLQEISYPSPWIIIKLFLIIDGFKISYRLLELAHDTCQMCGKITRHTEVQQAPPQLGMERHRWSCWRAQWDHSGLRSLVRSATTSLPGFMVHRCCGHQKMIALGGKMCQMTTALDDLTCCGWSSFTIWVSGRTCHPNSQTEVIATFPGGMAAWSISCSPQIDWCHNGVHFMRIYSGNLLVWSVCTYMCSISLQTRWSNPILITRIARKRLSGGTKTPWCLHRISQALATNIRPTWWQARVRCQKPHLAAQGGDEADEGWLLRPGWSAIFQSSMIGLQPSYKQQNWQQWSQSGLVVVIFQPSMIGLPPTIINSMLWSWCHDGDAIVPSDLYNKNLLGPTQHPPASKVCMAQGILAAGRRTMAMTRVPFGYIDTRDTFNHEKHDQQKWWDTFIDHYKTCFLMGKHWKAWYIRPSLSYALTVLEVIFPELVFRTAPAKVPAENTLTHWHKW